MAAGDRTDDTCSLSLALLDRIKSRKARIGVIGLGYVGLPLAVEFARAGFDVTGFDVDEREDRRDQRRPQLHPRRPAGDLARGWSRTAAPRDDRHDAAWRRWTSIDICVPTPLRKTKDPDLSYVVKAVEAVAATLRTGQLIILESTTYPGTTEEVVQPMLEAKGLKADVDFFLAFSPERVDPGNAQLHDEKDPESRRRHRARPAPKRACALYGAVVRRSCRSARPASPRW